MRKFMYDPGDEQEQSSGGGEQGSAQTGTAATAIPAPAPAPLTGQATDEQIAAWKKANPQGIYSLTSGNSILYFKRPSWEEVDCAMSKVDKEHPLAMGEELVELTLLGGDENALQDVPTRLSIHTAVIDQIESKKATLVNL